MSRLLIAFLALSCLALGTGCPPGDDDDSADDDSAADDDSVADDDSEA